MKFKKQVITTALAMVLSISAIMAPKSIAYAASESQDEIKNGLINFVEELNTKDAREVGKVEFQHKNIEQNPYSIQATTGTDLTNPNNYRLITNDLENTENMVILMDDYLAAHVMAYFDYDNTTKELGFVYASSVPDIKSDYINMELYADNNGKLTMVDSYYWDMEGISEDILAVPVIPDLYNKAYLYFRVGVADTVDGAYEDSKLFKIKNPFYVKNDIAGHWAEASIRDFMNKGYVGGYSDGSFRPNNSITRAEFVTIFNKTFGLTTKSGKVFSDTKTHWARNEIDVAVSNGVCNGKSATEFKPNDPITREEAAVMISNYKKLSDANYDKINQYKDKGQVSSWAKNSVEGMMEKGFMGGYSDGTFRPKGKITRAEAVVTLSRVK